MKKLKFAQGTGEVLTVEELKNVFGGSGTGSNEGSRTVHCVVRCYDSDDDPNITTTSVGSTCPAASNYGCTTSHSCCNCTTY